MSNKQISTEKIKTISPPDITNKNDDDGDNKLKKTTKTTTTTKVVSNGITPPNSINPIPGWVFLQCKQLTSNNTPICCGVSGGGISPGTYCIAWEINSNDNSQLWQQTSDGHLISRLKGNYAMDFIIEGDTNQLITNDWNISTSQIWTLNDNDQLVNGTFTNMCIGLKGAIDDPNFTPVNGTELILAQPSDSSNPCFQWETSPSYPLNSILTQPAEPFPTFTGNQAIAFQDISQQLANVDDIRTEYTNLSTSLTTFQFELQAMKCPSYITKEQFNEIRDQLYKEFGIAQAIINLFNNYTSFHQSVFSNGQTRFNEISTLVNIEEGSTISIAGSMISFFSGLLYTVLCAIPGADGAVAIAPILANVIQTGINLGVSASSAGDNILPDPFEIAYSELWGLLSSNFENLATTVGNMEILILQDWGMMQQTYTLINLLTSPKSLAWSPLMTSEMVSAAVPGFENSILQMLMPSKYQIYRWDPNNNNGVKQTGDIPDYCQWTDPNGIQYFIADINYTTVYPVSDLMSVLWDKNNVSKEDFFLSNNGWNFPISLMNNDYTIATPTITNHTSTPMCFQIQFGKTQINKYTLPTFSSTLSTDFDQTWDGDGNSLEVTVWDLSENYIASLNIQVVDHFDQGSTVSLVDSYTKPGYYLGSISNQGSVGYCFTPSINVQIYQSSNNSN